MRICRIVAITALNAPVPSVVVAHVFPIPGLGEFFLMRRAPLLSRSSFPYAQGV
jgi:hypothetical protein